MKDSLETLKSMVLEWRHFEMEVFIKDYLKITYLMDKV